MEADSDFSDDMRCMKAFFFVCGGPAYRTSALE